MFHDLLFEKFDTRISLIDLPGHFLDITSRLSFISLQVLDLIIGLPQLRFDFIDNLVPLTLALVGLLDLPFFGQDVR